jgi:hypothetical protein
MGKNYVCARKHISQRNLPQTTTKDTNLSLLPEFNQSQKRHFKITQ